MADFTEHKQETGHNWGERKKIQIKEVSKGNSYDVRTKSEI